MSFCTPEVGCGIVVLATDWLWRSLVYYLAMTLQGLVVANLLLPQLLLGSLSLVCTSIAREFLHMANTKNSRFSPRVATVFVHLLAVVTTVLVLVWLLHFREGLAFKSHVKAQIFNIHPVLMVIGVILIGGEAIMAYKTIPGAKRTQKKVHLMLHLVALITGIVGIYAVFKFHQEMNIPHLYSLHSWIGIGTICLYGLQWIFSFFTFTLPHSKSAAREAVAPWHIFGGIVIFLLAICTSIMGLIEKFTFLKLQQTQEALIVNFTGLMIVLFAVMVGLVVTLPHL